MKTRTLLFIAILVCGFSSASRTDAQTTTVRGQLLKGGKVPAAGVQVTLNNASYGRSTPVTTGSDGMYYLYNVPHGEYFLEIWISKPPLVYPVKVLTSPYSDLPRLPVP